MLADAAVFNSGEPDLNEEVALADALTVVTTEGAAYCHIIYSTRSLSKAIPQVKSPDQPNRMQLYEETTRVLQPHVDNMKAFMSWHTKAIDQTTAFINSANKHFMAQKRDIELISPPLVIAAARLLAMLFTLNNLVNVKTAWKNDYSAYKR